MSTTDQRITSRRSPLPVLESEENGPGQPRKFGGWRLCAISKHARVQAKQNGRRYNMHQMLECIRHMTLLLRQYQTVECIRHNKVVASADQARECVKAKWLLLWQESDVRILSHVNE